MSHWKALAHLKMKRLYVGINILKWKLTDAVLLQVAKVFLKDRFKDVQRTLINRATLNRSLNQASIFMTSGNLDAGEQALALLREYRQRMIDQDCAEQVDFAFEAERRLIHQIERVRQVVIRNAVF